MDSKNDNGISTEVENRLDDLFGNGEREGDNLEQKGTLEVDRRLDNFFGEDDKNPAGKEKKTDTGPKSVVDELSEDSPLKDLQSVVLSLEWEISDQVMQRLDEETTKLEKQCKDDKIIVAFLQLLSSLGKYIRKKQADAHPDSIALVNSVYENLEYAMITDGLSEAEKKKMLVAEVSKYKKLKEHIASGGGKPSVKIKPEEKPLEKSVPRVTEVPSVSTPPVSSVSVSDFESEEDVTSLKSASGGTTTSSNDVLAALENINATIKSEFKALREELKLWRESFK